MIGVRASERKKRAELFEISADFSAFLTKFQHFSAHISALLCKVFALNFLTIEQFVRNFWKFSRPGNVQTVLWPQMMSFDRIDISSFQWIHP